MDHGTRHGNGAKGWRLAAWLKASRLPSQLFILTPLLAGQLYAVAAGLPLNWQALLLAHAFGLFIQLFIVQANDVADLDADRPNRTFTFFSGGSRVLVDGDLSRRELRTGAILAALLALACATGLAVITGHLLPIALWALAIALLLAYSHAPLRLNYRGGGELLQMAGTGIVLPLLGWHAQAAGIAGFPWRILPVLLPTMLACAIGTSLPDEPSDRHCGKRSATVLLGQMRAQGAVMLLHGLSLALLLAIVAARHPERLAWAIALPPIPCVALILCRGGQPGTPRLLRFGVASILATLALTLASVAAA